MERSLLGWFGPLTPGGGLERVVDAAAIKYPPAALPANADQWEDTYEIQAPSAIWTLQESAAASVDRVGAHDLETVIGTPEFAQAGESGRRAVLFDGTEALEVADATFLDSDAATSISIWLRVFIPASLATTRRLAGKRDTADDVGWGVRVTSGGFATSQADDGAGAVNAPISIDHRNGWHSFVYVVDRGLDEARLTTDLGAASPGNLAGHGAMEPAAAFGLGAGYNFDAEDLLVTYAAAWQGYALSAAEAATLAAVTP